MIRPVDGPFSLLAIEEEHRAATGSRGDDPTQLRLSDVGKCIREVWARRNGKPLLQPDAKTRRKWALGHAVEDILIPAWRAKLELDVEVHIEKDGVLGHVDAVILGGKPLGDNPLDEVIVVEIKSTTFYPTYDAKTKTRTRFAPTAEEMVNSKRQYMLQAASYADALGATLFVTVVVCRESGMAVEYWWRTADWVDEVRQLMDYRARFTAPGSPIAPANPPAYAVNAKGENWMCKYCSFSACERNTNPDALRVDLAS